ncbi:hypothetical protein OU792_13180 [Algoriphagus sp. NF]|jgi:hypothetical protein|uniref:Uncharacterized protein n=1 Tax=Algoriphagus marincola TaxID=264027 RepID=A0ABS7NAF1_9BACT|nr:MULTISPECIES: hypothetical protein [Algoriphagus]MBY5952205.1 hypothetical protein [Algoriphagus marincola]MCR9082180.1 hypothetical protein [Cyclobacteriaceae bacterium]MDE0560946.1 hypothetical protein [Algoriphagus sp. NF]
MKISSQLGNFKIIQTIKDRDELLILGSWADLVKLFDSKRTFRVNENQNLFGIYVCKQECAEFLTRILQDIDYHEWEDFQLEKSSLSRRYLA